MRRRDLLRQLGLAPFAPLAVYAAQSGGAVTPRQTAGGDRPPDVDIALRAAPGEARLLPGEPTRVWRFSASVDRGPGSAAQAIPEGYLGPVLRVRRGQRLRVRFGNGLAEPSIVHWHGLDVPELADGHPRLAVEPGADYVYDFEVTNRAGTYWYHPHPHMRTAAQVYQGLAGLFLVSDPEEDALGLPSGDGELLCVLQDRRFDAGNQFHYLDGPIATGRPGAGRGMGAMRGGMGAMMQAMNGWLGDRLLVSGRLQPVQDVARRTYRVRLVNGSNARIYRLAWSDGSPFVVIGGDGGLAERARRQEVLTLAPGQRADTLLELSDHAPGRELALRTLEFPPEAAGRVGMMGESSPLPNGAAATLLTLRVTSARGARVRLPERLCAPPAHWDVVPGAPVRRVALQFRQMTWSLGGRTFDMADVASDETVAAGSTHVWEIENRPNGMGMMAAHPIHLHGTQYRVLSRAGADGNPLRAGIADGAPTDTVLVLPGETVRLQVTFSRHPGLYLYHCHILEHEDMGMMRNFRITA